MLQGSIGGEGVVGLRLNHGSEVGGRGAMLPSYGFDPAEVVIHARSLPGSGLGKGFVLRLVHVTKLFEGGACEFEIAVLVGKAALLGEGEG